MNLWKQFSNSFLLNIAFKYVLYIHSLGFGLLLLVSGAMPGVWLVLNKYLWKGKKAREKEKEKTKKEKKALLK